MFSWASREVSWPTICATGSPTKRNKENAMRLTASITKMDCSRRLKMKPSMA